MINDPQWTGICIYLYMWQKTKKFYFYFLAAIQFGPSIHNMYAELCILTNDVRTKNLLCKASCLNYLKREWTKSLVLIHSHSLIHLTPHTIPKSSCRVHIHLHRTLFLSLTRLFFIVISFSRLFIAAANK